MVNSMVVLNIPIVKELGHMTKILVFECKAYNKSTHNKQEEKQEESWRAPNITGNALLRKGWRKIC